MDNLLQALWATMGLVALALLALGGLLLAQGFRARRSIRAALRDEAVTTGAEASLPRVPVTGIRTARSQADLIRSHTVGRYGPYSTLARDDPNRDHYLKGLTLRNSLHLAILAFGVADLVMATGAALMLIGAVFGAFSLAAMS